MTLPVIYLIRHGCTRANADFIIAGTLETDLIADGYEQGRAAGNFLRCMEIKNIYASPQLRVRQTVDAMNLELPVEYDERLKEMYFGSCEGKSFEFRQKYNITFERLYRDRQFRFPDGDSYDDAEPRAKSFIREKLDNTAQPVIVVTHGAFGKVLLATLLPDKIEKIIPFVLGNADVVKIENGNFEVVFETQKSGSASQIKL